MVLKALKDAYKGRILTKEYPCGILFLEIPLEDVDVNVHPAKMEVRFRKESKVFSLVYKGVKSAIDKKNIYVSFPQDCRDNFKNCSFPRISKTPS